MRFRPILAVAAGLVLGTGGAHAQAGSPDAAPYSVEEANPALHPTAMSGKPKRAADKSTAIPVPQSKPEALKTAATLTSTLDAKPADKAEVPPATAAALPKAKPEILRTPAAAELAAVVPAPDAAILPAVASSNPAQQGDTLYGNAADERLLIQAALLWSGDFTGIAEDGDDPQATAIKNFQKRKNYKITGTLSERERSELLGAARGYQDEFGWNVVVDPATGIRIGLPTKMVPVVHEAPRGTRWSSRYGDVQVETFRYLDSSLKLATLYEREKQEPAARKIEYSILRDDGFFISGMQGLRKFAVRAQVRNGEIRGFAAFYDQAMDSIVAPVMVAMASAFSPFPQTSAPFASLVRSVDYGNGLVVSSQGHIVADARLTQGCQVIVAGGFGDAERIAEDKGLALLRVYGARKFKPLALTRHASVTKGDVTIAGIPDPKDAEGRPKLAEIKAKLIGSALELREPTPMAGFSGAIALDADGRFLGITEMRNAALASLQPVGPPVRIIRAEQIHAFLDAQNIAQPTTTVADPREAVVRIICVRK